MKYKEVIIAATWGAMITGSALTHGTSGWLEEGEGIRVHAEYGSGEPMSYAAVKIIAPESTVEFQSGHTDRNGIFMFTPDRQGEWQVTIDDGMGHKLVLTEEVTPDKALVPSKNRKSSTSTAMGISAGLAIITGISGILYGHQQKRKLYAGQDNENK